MGLNEAMGAEFLEGKSILLYRLYKWSGAA